MKYLIAKQYFFHLFELTTNEAVHPKHLTLSHKPSSERFIFTQYCLMFLDAAVMPHIG